MKRVYVYLRDGSIDKYKDRVVWQNYDTAGNLVGIRVKHMGTGGQPYDYYIIDVVEGWGEG